MTGDGGVEVVALLPTYADDDHGGNDDDRADDKGNNYGDVADSGGVTDKGEDACLPAVGAGSLNAVQVPMLMPKKVV
eukprot:6240319-Alexandrium_andersonii.AAC.1